MRKLLLCLSSILFITSIAFAECETRIDGVCVDAMELMQYDGIASDPAVSPIGSARQYFDPITGKLKCSEDGNDYVNCVGTVYTDADAQAATGWTKSGTNVILTTSTDNVGIGSSVPQSKLDIGSSGVLTGYAFNTSSSASYARVAKILSSTSSLTISGNSSTDAVAVKIDSNGNVGIGTTYAGTAKLAVMNGNVGIGNSAPGANLDISGGGTTNLNINAVYAGAGGNDSYTKLLLHLDGTNGSITMPDSSPVLRGNASVYGDAKLSTSVKKIGTASLSLDGNGDYIAYADSDDWNFGSGDFTVDFWVNLNSTTTSYGPIVFFRQYIVSTTEIRFTLNGSTFGFDAAVSGVSRASYSATKTLNTGEWYHIALVRNGSNIYIFVNGEAQTLTVNTAIGSNEMPDSTSVFNIGKYNDGGGTGYTNGYFDEYRVSKGIARWTSNFTPPTAEYDAPVSTPSLTFQQSGTTAYTLGVDGSDNKFKLGTTALGTGTVLTVASGNVGIGTTAPTSALQTAGTVSMRTTGGVQGLYQNSDGNVGVGMTTGVYKLNVNGTVGFTGGAITGLNDTANYLKSLNAAANNHVVQFFQAGSYKWDIGTTTKMTMDSTGNVGIGNTAPTRALEVTGSAYVTGDLLTNNAKGLATKDTGGTFRDVLRLNASNVVEIGSSALATNTIFLSTGNVGIGTTVPASKLDVTGRLRNTVSAVGGNEAWYTALSRPNTDGDSAFWTFYTNTAISADFFGKAGFYFQGGTSDTYKQFQVHVANASVPKIVVTGGGNVGIGTTAPTSNLHTVGTVSLRTAAGTQGLYQTSDGNVGIGGTALGTAKLYVNGNVGIGLTNPGAVLDANGSAYIRGSAYVTGTALQANKIQSYNSNTNLTLESFTSGYHVIINPSAGNVGIGDSAPTSNLSIKGGETTDVSVNALPSFDSYTKTASHFDGTDAATAYTDPVAGAYTFVGTAQLDTAQKQFGTASLLLDGNSDYVSLPDSDDWNFFNGDFTVDFWVRFNSVSQWTGFFSQYQDGANTIGANWYNTNSRLQFYTYTSSGAVDTHFYCIFNPSINTWYHIAFVRYGNSAKIFVDGVEQSVTLDGFVTIPNFSAPLKVGYYTDNAMYLDGWIDEFRISKGIARWTSNFTPPTVAYGSAYYPSVTLKGSSTQTAKIWNDADKANALKFDVPSTTRMMIDVNGNIGIGTTAPTVKLEVNGALKVNSGGSAGKAMCWKSDGISLGYCSDAPGAGGNCTCN